MTNIEELNILGIQSEQAASILARVWGDTRDLEEFGEDRALFLLFRHGDMAFFMYERGAISEDRLRSALRPIPLTSQRSRDFWDQHKNSFTKEYQNYIDNMIASITEDGRSAGE